jgi:hypothetical protein
MLMKTQEFKRTQTMNIRCFMSNYYQGWLQDGLSLRYATPPKPRYGETAGIATSEYQQRYRR